ncbi:MAG: crossover junction endodeoxyribonuclease RuvC [Dehalococcoidia bacterium]|nr:crossover junction endodeoxyribonuclease RuvC [Dehalococcoidia bacterium]
MPVRVLGIDPGIALMGYGVIENEDGRLTAIDFGCFSTTPAEPHAGRLRFLYEHLTALIDKHQPSEAAVELFVARNLKTALIVGQARGVALLAAANRDIPVYEYSPLDVKQSVTGYGRGSKEQVQELVKLQLGLDAIPRPDDAADALAIALCHIARIRLSRVLSGELNTGQAGSRP